jgi:hypothetical protein
MTQAPQSGGGRTTAYVNKHTDQLGRLADKATDQARNVAQQVEEFANGERIRRLPATSRVLPPARRSRKAL